MTTEFYSSPDWQGTSGPYINRNVQLDDLYPQGAGDGKDVLENGHHPILAIGDQAAANGRGINQKCGVVVTYEDAVERAVLNIAPGFVCKQYVANVLTYAGGAPATWGASLYIGQPVYLDDSTDLAAGITLSTSPLNEDGLANPLAGWLWYDQTEEEDVGVGGGNADAWPKTADNSKTVYTSVHVLLR